MIRWQITTGLVAVALLFAGAAESQVVLDETEEVELERPEAWAMLYFGSVTQFTALDTPGDLDPGDFELALDAGWIPSLSEEERRVGFNGTKVEDLNRSEIFGRLRAGVGLPGRFSLEIGIIPPIEVDGIEPRQLALAVARPVVSGRSWRLTARLTGLAASFEGDITCDRDSVAAGDDPERNPFNCLEPSRDEMELWSGRLGLVASAQGERWRPYAGVALSYWDAELEVDARYGNIVDHTRLVTDGTTWDATVGLVAELGRRSRVAVEGFYTPLEVRRDPAGSPEDEDLFTVRAIVRYRLR